MKRTLLLAGLAVALCATSAMAARDNFNRTALGNKWVVPSGSLFITSDQLQGSSLAIGYDKRSSSDTTVSTMVFTTSTDLEYGAVASGDIASGNNAFVKIQSQDGTGQFTAGAFYTGNNGGGDFFALNAPVPSPARLTLSFCNTVAKMKITSSAGTQVYKFDYGTTFGTGGGLGTYGSVALDNYKSSAGGCSFDESGTWITKSNAKDLSLSK
jgi:hypothetical protein